MTPVLTLGLLLAACGPVFADDWVHVDSVAGRFQAEFPSTPEESTQLLETDSGRIPHTTVMAESASGQVAYGIVYSDYPQAILDVPPDELLQDVRDTAAGNLKGRVISESPLALASGPAREFSIAGEVEGQPLFYHSRVLLIGTRLYELRIVRVGDAPVDLADAVRFFASFQELTAAPAETP